MGVGLRGVRISSRITALAVAGAVLALAVGGMGWRSAMAQDDEAQRRSVLLRAQSLANALDSSVNQVELFLNAHLAFPDQGKVFQPFQQKNIAGGDANLAALRALPLSSADQASVDRLAAPWHALTDEVLAAHRKIPTTTSPQARYAIGKGTFDAGAAISTTLGAVKQQLDKKVTAADTAERAAAGRTQVIIGSTLGSGAVVLLLFAWRVRRSIVRPLTATVGVLHQVAERNYAVPVDTEGVDEVAAMSRALDQVLDEVRALLRSVRDGGHKLERSSATLVAIGQDVDDSARDAGIQVSSAADASEQVRSGVRIAVHGADQMSAAIREIADNAGRASGVAGEAVRTSQATTAAMGQLAASTAQISSVVSLITSIAEQTNLLALNATIEAARAGDAGKGFSVVASEVKDLAQSTGRATEDISRLIDAIQSDSEQAIAAIEQISRVVSEIHDYQNAIAGAVEEQTATTNEMAHAFAEAQVSTDSIASSIEGVTRTAQRTAEGARSTRVAAEEISSLATELNALVGRFQLP